MGLTCGMLPGKVSGMVQKLRRQYEGAIGHVTFRGNTQQAIFADNRDRERRTKRVGESAEEFGVLDLRPSDIRLRSRGGRDRGIVALALMRRFGLTERAAAAELGLGTVPAVSYLVRQVKARCRVAPNTADLVHRVAYAEVARRSRTAGRQRMNQGICYFQTDPARAMTVGAVYDRGAD